MVVQQLFNIHGDKDCAQPLHTHILAAQHIAPADKIGVIGIRRQQGKAAGGAVQGIGQLYAALLAGVGEGLPHHNGVAVQIDKLQRVRLPAHIELFQQQRAHAGQQIVILCGFGVCRRQLGQLALNCGIHRNAAGQHVHLLQIVINALDEEVQLLQGFLVELFLKNAQTQMQRTDHNGTAEQRHHRKDADEFLRYRQVKKSFFEAGEHEERLLWKISLHGCGGGKWLPPWGKARDFTPPTAAPSAARGRHRRGGARCSGSA